jgi:hypothetical protein
VTWREFLGVARVRLFVPRGIFVGLVLGEAGAGGWNHESGENSRNENLLHRFLPAAAHFRNGLASAWFLIQQRAKGHPFVPSLLKLAHDAMRNRRIAARFPGLELWSG